MESFLLFAQNKKVKLWKTKERTSVADPVHAWILPLFVSQRTMAGQAPQSQVHQRAYVDFQSFEKKTEVRKLLFVILLN